MSGAISGLPALALYPSIVKNESVQITKFESQDPQTKADLAYFTQAAPKLTTPDALLKDYRALKVVLGAFGMGSQIGQTGLLKQLMTQDPTSSSSLAQRSANPLWMRFAKFMSNWSSGSPLADSSTVNVIKTQYATTAYEAAEGKMAPGLQEALYFRRTIASITSVNGLLSDPTALKVVVTGSNLPDQFGMLDYDEQVNLLNKTVDLKKFQDPAYVDQFTRKYLAMNQAENSGPDPTGMLALFNGSSSGADLLGALYPNSGTVTTGIGALFTSLA